MDTPINNLITQTNDVPKTDLDELLSDIETTFDKMYPWFDMAGNASLQNCECYGDLLPSVLETLAATKWVIDYNLIRIVLFVSAVSPYNFCMKGFLGQAHKSNINPKDECAQCHQIRLDIKKFDSLIGNNREDKTKDYVPKFLQAWNSPRQFKVKNYL